MPVHSEERRPDPERLLQQVMAQERQSSRERLKIFLGYASGVGKTVRMLDEARRRLERGQDVVIGAVQDKRPAEAEGLLSRFEVIPPLLISGIRVMDVEAILRRKPGVCIVDGVAYDNPPGSRHAKRWEDVQELVQSGITVITSLNIQYIEEERQEAEKLTGRHVSTTVPKAFLSLADEIVVVDVPGHMLLARTGEPDVDPERARQLAQLREMTLLLTAEAVDRQLTDSLGADQIWSAHERILVCITPRANTARMLASGKRNADRFRGDLLVAYVEQPGATPKDKQVLDNAMQAAKALGAETHVLDGDDAMESILRFARKQRITQIFVGHSLRESWRQQLFGGPLDRLIRDAEGIDVRIFPH